MDFNIFTEYKYNNRSPYLDALLSSGQTILIIIQYTTYNPIIMYDKTLSTHLHSHHELKLITRS